MNISSMSVGATKPLLSGKQKLNLIDTNQKEMSPGKNCYKFYVTVVIS